MIPKSKNGAELALNVVIIAVMALLVLVIVLFIFTGKTQIFSKGADSCATRQGVCVPLSDSCSGPIVPAKDCDDKEPKEKCCVNLK